MMEERLDQIRYKKYYDIVGSLPLELLLKIAEDLEPADIVRSQRVLIHYPVYRHSKIVFLTGTVLGLQTMALHSLIRRNHQVCFAPNACVLEH